MREKILFSVQQAILAIEQLRSPSAIEFIESSAIELKKCFENGNKVLVAGNGGSMCDASHCTEELTGIFRSLRPALPAIALNDPGHMSCVANDLGYDHVFSRGIEALGKEGDVFIGLTTSGRSKNIIKAFETAKQKKLKTIAFLGKDGGPLKGVADLELIISGFQTSDRIQEAHMTVMHIMIEILEVLLFPAPEPLELALTK